MPRPDRAQPGTRRYLSGLVLQEHPRPAGYTRRRALTAVAVVLLAVSCAFPIALIATVPAAVLAVVALARNYRADSTWYRTYTAALNQKIREHGLR